MSSPSRPPTHALPAWLSAQTSATQLHTKCRLPGGSSSLHSRLLLARPARPEQDRSPCWSGLPPASIGSAVSPFVLRVPGAGSPETIHYGPTTGVVPAGAGRWPQVWDFGCTATRRPRPPQLTPSDPEFGGRAQTGKATPGGLNARPEPGGHRGRADERAVWVLEQTWAGERPLAEPHHEPDTSLFSLESCYLKAWQVRTVVLGPRFPRQVFCSWIPEESSHDGSWVAQPHTRRHLGPQGIPAEGLCCAVFEVPRGQRDDHFSKKHPPGKRAQVPHGHLQPPGHQLGRLHLVLQRQNGESAGAPGATLLGEDGSYAKPGHLAQPARTARVPNQRAFKVRVSATLRDPQLPHLPVVYAFL